MNKKCAICRSRKACMIRHTNTTLRYRYRCQYKRDKIIQHHRRRLTILENLRHRGAEGADANSGDGAGILVQIPHQFFCRECGVLGFTLPDEATTASA